MNWLRITAIALVGAAVVAGGIYGICRLQPDKPVRRSERREVERERVAEIAPRIRGPRVALRAKQKGKRTGWEAAHAERVLEAVRAELGEDAFALRIEEANVDPSVILIDGVEYEGARRPSDLEHRICTAFEGERPEACARIQPPVRVAVTFLIDARCGDCNLHAARSEVERRLPGAVIRVVDYADTEGAELWSEIKPLGISAAIVEASQAELDPDAAAFAASSREVGSSYVLSLDNWIPECADPDGCASRLCANEPICRPERPGTLELWTTGQSSMAMLSMDVLMTVRAEFIDAGAKLGVEVHHIGADNVSGGGAGALTSAGGADALEEDRRDVCVAKRYPGAFLDYLQCRSAGFIYPWVGCTDEKTGIDKAVIVGCASSPTEADAMVRK